MLKNSESYNKPIEEVKEEPVKEDEIVAVDETYVVNLSLWKRFLKKFKR